MLGVGLGAQNAAARALSVPDLKTTVLTLTITGAAADSRLVGGKEPGGTPNPPAAAMMGGACIGALAVLNGHPTLSLLLAMVLLVAASVAATLLARSDAP
ncbi:DUF1275 family protein [Streptomyces sp. M10(2022)]